MNENWLFTTRIPFTDATRSELGQSDKTISGLGDVSIAAIYSPWASDGSPWSRLTFNAGFILPTGEARDNPRIGGVNPSVFQLGTGTTQLTLGANYFGDINDDWTYFTSANITLPLYESSKDFRPAETFFFRAGASRSILEGLSAKLSLDLFHGGRDEFLGMEIGDTGSTTLSLTPALVYSINDDLSASASVAIPIYRRVNETALAVGSLWSFGLSYSF
ncbi:MAG: transporter [Akkermansiaceae bacterium]